MTDGQYSDLERRITRVEDTLEIQQLPIRYALAVDERDVDAWVALFAPDVVVGKGVSGRGALREVIVPELRRFYRSVHQIAGHRVEFVDDVRALGHVYCRAEHEVADRWIVMAIRYDDAYQKIDGTWYFGSRKERHWYSAGLDEHPQEVGFDSWGAAAGPPPLPQRASTWGGFWTGVDTSGLTSTPVHD